MTITHPTSSDTVITPRFYRELDVVRDEDEVSLVIADDDQRVTINLSKQDIQTIFWRMCR